MELQELYSLEIMDLLIGIAVDEDRMDIKSFKALLKEYNDGKRELVTGGPETLDIPNSVIHEPELTRDCSYYEDICKGNLPWRQ